MLMVEKIANQPVFVEGVKLKFLCARSTRFFLHATAETFRADDAVVQPSAFSGQAIVAADVSRLIPRISERTHVCCYFFNKLSADLTAGCPVRRGICATGLI
jgi:hypothetical protein